MLNEGIGLMLTGMGTVFSFLVILWIAVSIMGCVVGWLNKIFPEPTAAIKTIAKKAVDDTEVAIAVAMAKLKG